MAPPPPGIQSDNFGFCLLHDLAHPGRHFQDREGNVFIDDLQLHNRDGERDREADGGNDRRLCLFAVTKQIAPIRMEDTVLRFRQRA